MSIVSSNGRELPAPQDRWKRSGAAAAVRPLLLLLILVAGGPTLRAQIVTIVTGNGEEYVGILLEEPGDTTVILSGDGATIRIPGDAIDPTPTAHAARPPSGPPDRFWGVGATFGMPGGINLIVERRFTDRVGLRGNVGYMKFPVGPIATMAGAEIDALVRLANSGPAEHQLVAGAGAMIFDQTDFDPFGALYGHVGYNLHWAGFNTLGSLGIGYEIDGDVTTLWTFQIGFVHRLE